MARYRVVRSAGLVAAYEADPNPDKDYMSPEYAQPMSIWWQVIP
jgi:hypothetical protein